MSNINLNSGYGQAQASNVPFTTGKIFVVDASGSANFNNIDELYTPDSQGVARRYSTATAALAACTIGAGDRIILASDFSTALTAADLLAAETKGVRIQSALVNANGIGTIARATSTLPQTGDLSLFTVTGRVRIISIIGETTTVIQTQANNTLLKINPTVGADVDLCAAADITADAVGSQYNITGTLGDALVETASGAFVAQAAPVVVTAGVIELECSASSTGAIKWTIQYEQIDPGSAIFAA